MGLSFDLKWGKIKIHKERNVHLHESFGEDEEEAYKTKRDEVISVIYS